MMGKIRMAVVRMGVPSQEVEDLLQIILLRIIQRTDTILDPSEAGIVAFARAASLT